MCRLQAFESVGRDPCSTSTANTSLERQLECYVRLVSLSTTPSWMHCLGNEAVTTCTEVKQFPAELLLYLVMQTINTYVGIIYILTSTARLLPYLSSLLAFTLFFLHFLYPLLDISFFLSILSSFSFFFLFFNLRYVFFFSGARCSVVG